MLCCHRQSVSQSVSLSEEDDDGGQVESQAPGGRQGCPPLYQEQKCPLSLNVRMQGFYPLSSLWIFVLVFRCYYGIKMVHYVNSKLSLSQYHVLWVIVAIFFLSFPIKFPLVICSQASILDMEIGKIY